MGIKKELNGEEKAGSVKELGEKKDPGKEKRIETLKETAILHLLDSVPGDLHETILTVWLNKVIKEYPLSFKSPLISQIWEICYKKYRRQVKHFIKKICGPSPIDDDKEVEHTTRSMDLKFLSRFSMFLPNKEIKNERWNHDRYTLHINITHCQIEFIFDLGTEDIPIITLPFIHRKVFTRLFGIWYTLPFTLTDLLDEEITALKEKVIRN